MVAAVGCVTIALADMLGVAQQRPQLVADMAGRVTTHVPAALLLAMAGFALALLQHRFGRASFAIGSLVAATCGISLAQAPPVVPTVDPTAT